MRLFDLPWVRSAGMSNLPDSEMTAPAGVQTLIEAFCQHERLIASRWIESPGQIVGHREIRVTAYYCPACRATLWP